MISLEVASDVCAQSASHCGRCDFDSFGGVINEEGENIGFCNLNMSYVYVGCRSNNGSKCQDHYQWACMYNASISEVN